MRCPACDVEMEPEYRQGVDILCCPECGGMWLESGDLDLIMERSLAYDAGRPMPDHRSHASGHQAKPKSLLARLFSLE